LIFKEGDRVKVVGGISKCQGEDYYHWGGFEEVSVGSTGTVSSVDCPYRVSVNIDNFGHWAFHPDEIELYKFKLISRKQIK
jgi:hypothetical protein